MERSVGMILIIPFGICFILLFLVCCFADEMKKMCILPSQIPPSYRSSSPVFNTSRRHDSYSVTSTFQNNRLNPDDIETQSLSTEQAETEQLIYDDLILAQGDIPIQINIRTNIIPNLHHIHYNTNCKNHKDNLPQTTSSNNTNSDDDKQSNSVDSIQHNLHNIKHSVIVGNGNNRSSQHYCLSRYLSDTNSVRVEEADTSSIIFQSSLQQLLRPNKSGCLDYPNIVNDNIIGSKLMTSRPVAAAPLKQDGTNYYPRQIEVSVSVNNLNTQHIHSLSQSTDN